MTFIKRYIGDKAFYRTLLVLALPLIIQQGITNFVSLLDNLMVGGLGTEQMSSVSIINQLVFVFNLTLFGGFSGASIFGAQFFGTGDFKGMRDTFRFRLFFGAAVCVIAFVVFGCFGDTLALLFLENDVNDTSVVAETLEFAMSYLKIMLFGLVPFMVVQLYAGLLREMGETFLPMMASLVAIFTNLVLNWFLIYGMFFFPEMGVAGAALATVISRFVEMIIVVIYTHAKKKRFRFIEGAYKSFRVPVGLVKKIAVTGTPLMMNEVLWSLGMTTISGNYSIRGLDVVAASNIAVTAWNLFCVVVFAMGSVVGIMVGQKLGAGEIEGAKDTARKLMFITVVTHIVIGIVVISVAGLIPLLYNTEPIVRQTAASMMRIQGLILPMFSYVHIAYFTLRSGGKTVITFLFDSCYMWTITCPLSYILCNRTTLPIVTVYLLVQLADVAKLVIAYPLLRSGVWAKNLLTSKEE